MEIPSDPPLTPEQRASLDAGVRQFNEGYYFECHDTLEELWSELRGPSRDFFQGLIQVSVAFYHLGNDNPEGAASMLERALSRFSRYGTRYCGLDLDGQRRLLLEWLSRIRSGEVKKLVAGSAPRWEFGPR